GEKAADGHVRREAFEAIQDLGDRVRGRRHRSAEGERGGLVAKLRRELEALGSEHAGTDSLEEGPPLRGDVSGLAVDPLGRAEAVVGHEGEASRPDTPAPRDLRAPQLSVPESRKPARSRGGLGLSGSESWRRLSRPLLVASPRSAPGGEPPA